MLELESTTHRQTLEPRTSQPEAEKEPAYLQVAIDGPAGAGKSEISRRIAQELELLYIDTGAMYRATAYLVLREEVDPDDVESIMGLLKNPQNIMVLQPPKPDETHSRRVTVLVGGVNVSEEIRSPRITKLSPRIAQHDEVRKFLLNLQHEMAASQAVVMEGRDTTYAGLPNAQIKIYLTARLEVRAERRFLEDLKTHPNSDREVVMADLIARDELDSQKNLRKVPGVWEIDTSDMTIDEVVQLIISKIDVVLGIN